MRILPMDIAEPRIAQLAHEAPAEGEAGGDLYGRIKPLIDMAMALVLLILTGPVMIVAMLLVRLTSRGPAIYSQRRLGLGGKVFTIYKIRTMYEDSEPQRPHLVAPRRPPDHADRHGPPLHPPRRTPPALQCPAGRYEPGRAPARAPRVPPEARAPCPTTAGG